MILTLFLLIGILSGLLAGLLGIGGGIIIIPCLVAIFSLYYIIPTEYIMHIAISTSLAAVIITTASASLAHHRRRSVRWDFVKILLPGLVSGAIVGAVIAHLLSANVLRIFFSLFLFVIAFRLFLIKHDEEPRQWRPGTFLLFAAFVMGMLSSILGVGGGVLMVPLLMHYGINTRQIAGTSATCGCAIATTATLFFLGGGFFSSTHLANTTGYVYWPAFFGIAIGSMVSAPFGARLAHAISTHLLKRCFAVLLFLIATQMLFFGK